VHGIFSEYYFDLVVAMLLFGLLGVMFVVDEYHVAIGVLVVDIMIVFMMISVIIFWSITLDVMLPLDY
jgi:hypothetical protein